MCWPASSLREKEVEIRGWRSRGGSEWKKNEKKANHHRSWLLPFVGERFRRLSEPFEFSSAFSSAIRACLSVSHFFSDASTRRGATPRSRACHLLPGDCVSGPCLS